MFMLLLDGARDYIQYARHSKGLTNATCESYQASLRHFAKWLEVNGYPNPDLDVLSTPVLRRYLYAQSAAGKRPRTIRGLFSAIKALIVFLQAQKAIAGNPLDGIELPRKDAPVRHVASDEECAGILDACEKLRTPRRQALARALFSVMIFTGIRAQEVLDLTVDDVSFDRKTLTVRQGKGQKTRILYPTEQTLSALREWMVFRSQISKKSQSKEIKTNYLFAFDTSRRIAYGGLLSMLKEVKLIAGYGDREHIQPHALRRAFATRLNNKGASITTIQHAMGHSEARTTFLYILSANDAAKPMADLASLHFSQSPKSEPSPVPTPFPADDKHRRAADLSRRRRTPAK